jgi:response regulator RpfG family c-di-GMP phosphodiesterase
MSAAPTPGPASAVPRILVLDDEEIIVLALRETLLLEGYDVVGHTDPLQALDCLRQQPLAAILSDQKMPGMTGLEFLAQARQLQPSATRILITAVLSLDTVIDAINKGEIYRFIVKPWLREELLVSVRNAVQRHELICSNESLQARTLAMNRELQAQVTHIGEQNDLLVKLNQTLQENLQRSIELCLHMIEAFLPALGNQARRVHQLCRAMGENLRLPPDEARILEISGWLHDIGLISVPRSLVRRWHINPKGLTDAERTLIQQHPLIGEELARFAQPLEKVGSAIRGHHERFDGHGYPDQLQGEQIPWLTRLLAVAVSFAESNDDPASTAELIKFGAGTTFDPEAVRVFLRALPRASVPRKELEVLLSELRPGMKLATGIYTASGMLLVPEGQCLTQTSIDKVLNHNRVSPINHSLLVYC